jgi:cyclase
MPLAKRVIARLDVKSPNLVKGVMLDGLRVIGDPAVYAKRYYDQGADEIMYQDIVASLYGRNGIVDLVKRTSESVFVPMTVGGGIRSVEDIRTMLLAGADKTAINTAAVHRPGLISDAAKIFGSQCVVVAVEYIGKHVFTDNGRERTGLDAYDWARKAVDYGAGEILLTSVEREGSMSGYDTEFIHRIASAVSVPVIAHGGCGSSNDVRSAADAGADGMAIAAAIHYNKMTITDGKGALHAAA